MPDPAPPNAESSTPALDARSVERLILLLEALVVPFSSRLALRPKEVCQALGIGERLLWSMTNANQIPHVRMSKAVLYPTDRLREWLAAKAKGGR